MRNKDRIKPFCERFAEAWERCPDMRFGQLLFNAFSMTPRDPFYIEDEEAISVIEKFVDDSMYYTPDGGKNGK